MNKNVMTITDPVRAVRFRRNRWKGKILGRGEGGEVVFLLSFEATVNESEFGGL